jgi:Fe-S cluster assembly iron-binding protein IscA
MKKDNTTEMVALAALIGAAGAAIYTLIITYKALERLENIELDFSNDSVLSSVFKKD